MQSATERRLTILEMLKLKQKMSHREIMEALKPEYDVCLKTVRRDIEYLSLKHGITIEKGRDGGVYLQEQNLYEWRPSFLLKLDRIKNLLSDSEDAKTIEKIIQMDFRDELYVKKK